MSAVKDMMISQIEAQKLRGVEFKSEPMFYQHLEARLDERRKNHALLLMNLPRDTVDFSSNDFLSLSSSGLLKQAFLDELTRNPNFELASTGSRLIDGNSHYIEALERDLSQFHRAKKGLIFNSGYDANVSIFSTIPIPGDVIVFDELVHASIHDGIAVTRASARIRFAHNDVNDLRKTLLKVRDEFPEIRAGNRTCLISIESVYSMDGNIAPLKAFVQVAKEVFPKGNAQWIIDEAHSTGLIGDRGNGLVCAEGLEDEFAIRLHTFGKALGCNGAIVLGNETIRTTLVNFSRGLIYTTAPNFPALAAIRGAYNLLMSGQTVVRQEALQKHIRHFYKTLHAHPVWRLAKEAGIIEIPAGENYENEPFLTQIVPVWTRARDNHHLAAHLHYADFRAWPIDYPVVPKNEGRVRIVFHSDNDIPQVEKLVTLITDWAGEMLEMKKSGSFPQCEWAEDVKMLVKKGIIKMKI